MHWQVLMFWRRDVDWNDAYANAPHIPNGADFPDQWRADADVFRGKMSVLGRARLGVMYGHGTREVVDLFLPDRTPKGIFVFVHGGFWRQTDGSLWSHFAQGALDNGWVVAMPTYDLCPRVRISDITRQVANAITVVSPSSSASASRRVFQCSAKRPTTIMSWNFPSENHACRIVPSTSKPA
jgi:acetyl esterase/lipase